VGACSLGRSTAGTHDAVRSSHLDTPPAVRAIVRQTGRGVHAASRQECEVARDNSIWPRPYAPGRPSTFAELRRDESARQSSFATSAPNEDSETLLCKRPARCRFEIALEIGCTNSIAEGHRGFNLPQYELGRMRNLAGIVPTQPVLKVIGQAHIEVFGAFLALQNVNVGKFKRRKIAFRSSFLNLNWLAES